MRTSGWSRGVAWTVLLTFSASTVACGPSAEETATATTVPATTVTTASLPPVPTPAPAPTPEPQPPEQLGREALRDLVAPVALYPDVVLASLLPATTFPEQVREAARLLGPGGTVQRIPDDRGWDGSVLGLLQFPDVLRWLDANPEWMDEMGQAVTYQQGDVLEAIQDYRRLARQAGNLESNRYQKVVQTRPEAPIRIEPARPDIVYVPSYDPAAAVQPQPTQPSGVNPWIAFGAGAAVGALGAWALYSIFDDDENETVVHHYHHGGRRIRRYDNYYFVRAGRRPPRSDWQPRERPYREPKRHPTRPGRLEHGPAATRRPRPVLPPTSRPSAPHQERREGQRPQREQRQLREQRRLEQREQRQLRQREQRQLREQRRERPRAQRPERPRQADRQRPGKRRGQNR